MTETKKGFHSVVSDYYDQDVDMGFEKRAQVNPLLDQIRKDFRMVTSRYPYKDALEIGCGPGFDVAWFASEFPDKQFTAVDISPKMVELTQKRLDLMKLNNARVFQSDERGLLNHFNAGQFDLVFVYFGALNTAADLNFAASQIYDLLAPGGFAVLTFVNKWYWREMAVQMLKFRFDIAFARLKKVWGGYSVDRYLPSRCYSPAEIKKAFNQFIIRERKGYSITFPAWYNYKKFDGKEEKLKRLWKFDESLQKTFLWSKGEYTLFVMQKP
jgi:SAM-dependent methyltransferase